MTTLDEIRVTVSGVLRQCSPVQCLAVMLRTEKAALEAVCIQVKCVL